MKLALQAIIFLTFLVGFLHNYAEYSKKNAKLDRNILVAVYAVFFFIYMMAGAFPFGELK